jgi:hypothetical protein
MTTNTQCDSFSIWSDHVIKTQSLEHFHKIKLLLRSTTPGQGVSRENGHSFTSFKPSHKRGFYKGCSSETWTHAATMPIGDGAATWWRECKAGSLCDTCVLRSGGSCSSKCVEWRRPWKYSAASFNSCGRKARRQVTFCVQWGSMSKAKDGVQAVCRASRWTSVHSGSPTAWTRSSATAGKVLLEWMPLGATPNVIATP